MSRGTFFGLWCEDLKWNSFLCKFCAVTLQGDFVVGWVRSPKDSFNYKQLRAVVSASMCDVTLPRCSIWAFLLFSSLAFVTVELICTRKYCLSFLREAQHSKQVFAALRRILVNSDNFWFSSPYVRGKSAQLLKLFGFFWSMNACGKPRCSHPAKGIGSEAEERH